MLIRSVCPNCQFAHEVSEKRLGDTIDCQRCDVPFAIFEHRVEEVATFEMESIFRSEDGLAQLTAPTHPHAARPEVRLKDGKHALVVPPPPRELWSAESATDEPSERFRTFKHDSRAVEKFLARDAGSDYSWLLVLGLVFMVLLICTFQFLLGCVIIFVR